MPRREGAFLVEDIFDLAGGLNTADSPFTTQPNEATGGFNYDFQVPGAVKKRGGHLRLNSTVDSQLKTIGFGLWDKPGSTRVPVRAAGTKLQNFDPSSYAFTSLYEDTARTTVGTCTITIAAPGVVTYTAHGLVATDPVQFTTSGALPTGLTASTTYYVKTVLTADTFTVAATAGGAAITTSGSQSGTHTLYKFTTAFLNSASTQPVVFNMFNNASAGVLWGAGGGASDIYGAVSATQVTANGVAAPTTSSFTATPAAGGSLTAGTYRYTLVYRKTSTQALSNALTATECSGTTSGGDLTLNLAWTLSNSDATRYDKIYIYRSSVGGAAGFTAGTLVAIVPIGDVSYSDTNNTSAVGYAASQNVPRADSTILDNSELPSGTYTCIATMKRRLVTAKNSTVYFSDINKSESWPTYQTITIPSGGAITSLGVISIASAGTAEIDEVLVIFKQSECWIITGDGILDADDIPNWTLKFLSNTGSPGQASVVSSEGYLFWVSYRGIYMWSGTGKPVRLSRKIWDLFQASGDIDKSKLQYCFGFYSQQRNEVVWVFSSSTYGEQYLALRLDLAHTVSMSSNGVSETKDMDGVFCADLLNDQFYGGMAFLAADTSTTETVYFGDDAGYVYRGFYGLADSSGTGAINYQFITPNFHFGTPNLAKRYHKVVVWVLDNGVYDLYLDYWMNYRSASADANTAMVEVNSSSGDTSSAGVWGVGQWGVATWGASASQVRPLTFNLSPGTNGCEGDSIKLRFRELSSNRAPVIYGYSIYYSEIATRKS